MKFLILAVLVCAVAGLPANRKYPKKATESSYGKYEKKPFDKIKAPKPHDSSYTVVDSEPVDSLSLPEFPSYSSHNGAAVDVMLPPAVEENSYGAYEAFPAEEMKAPAVDSYSEFSAAAVDDLEAPAKSSYDSVITESGVDSLTAPKGEMPLPVADSGDEKTYISYEGLPSLPLIAPEASSSYAEAPSFDDAMSAVAAMTSLNPPREDSESSYTAYRTGKTNSKGGLTAPKQDSYTHYEANQTSLTADEISALQAAGIPVPSTELKPPPVSTA